MQPSSLVFLVLFAIWAVYLLQHWVRRREYLATAKSVDRFSAAMRVLERRTPLPETDLTAPGRRSYDVSPARPSRVAGEHASRHPQEPEIPIEPSHAVRPTRFFHLLAGMSARRLRGLSLLASLLAAIFVSALAAFSVLPAWSVVVALAVVAADLVWLRQVALSERADGRAGGHQEHQEHQEGQEHQEHGSFPGHDEFVGSTSFAAEETVPDWAPHVGSSSHSGSDAPFDSESETRAGDGSRSPYGYGADPTLAIPVSAELTEPVELPAYVDPSSWAPVPVPPPTYTLKARAAEPVAMPAEFDEPTASECWSLDGLVYDCELDELVERRSATGA